jgi:hypothetical protein
VTLRFRESEGVYLIEEIRETGRAP